MSVNQKKLIVFHPALAPYRIDLFNYLNKYFKANFYFSKNNLTSQKFDQNELRSLCDFSFNLLRYGFHIKNKTFRFGVLYLLLKNKVDIIICSEYGQITLTVILYKYLFNRRVKIYTLSADSIENSKARKGLRKFLRDKTSFFMDGVILYTPIVSEWYKRNVNSSVELLEMPNVHANERYRNELKKSLGISNRNILKYKLQDKKVILSVGRIEKIKNLDLLLTSFSKVVKTNYILVVVGEGNELPVLMKKVKDLNLQSNVIFTGKLEGLELKSWYNIGQVFVLPSLSEPFGAVINEALLAGCYALCSDVAGAVSLIKPTINGNVFSPHHSDKLSDLLDTSLKRIQPINLPIELRPDSMPFQFHDKTEALISALKKDKN